MKPAEQGGQVHELLPWYVAGTLGPQESASFREHLNQCSACREELGVVEELRGQLERHGRDWIEEHPSPEQLVAVVGGESSDWTPEVRRHLELCTTCALEARWIGGEDTRSETGATGAGRPGLWPGRFWIPALAAAAGLVLGLLLPAGRDPVEPPHVMVPMFVPAPVRDGAEVPRVQPRPGQNSMQLHFEVDFLPGEFPLVLELQNESGEVVLRRDEITIEDLPNGANLFLSLPVRLMPPGRYAARIATSDGASPPLVIPFEVAPVQAVQR